MGLIVLFIVVQVIVAIVVVAVLKIKLKKELIEAALENLQTNVSSQTSGDVVVWTAEPIDAVLQERIENILKRKSAKAVLRFETDEQLKSGLVISVGGAVLDFSLANRLKKLIP